ncbi:MAG: TM2 domain-containing protein, partial [Actinomycetaceae bacterium]|nr:TM2 domain-containing protein [Actinomycetaceae bacterium]
QPVPYQQPMQVSPAQAPGQVPMQQMPPQQQPYMQGQPAAAPYMQGQPMPAQPMMGQQMQQRGQSSKSAVVAGILSFFFGGWGIGNFYAGHTGAGVGQIILFFVTVLLIFIPIIGWAISALTGPALGIWALIDTIMYLTKAGGHAYDGDGNLLQ